MQPDENYHDLLLAVSIIYASKYKTKNIEQGR